MLGFDTLSLNNLAQPVSYGLDNQISIRKVLGAKSPIKGYMTMTVLLFPGQGAQFRGMGKELFELFPDHIKLACDVLGYPIDKVCLSNPKGVLSNTRFTQPAVFLVSALSYLKWVNSSENEPEAIAGHSLGEFSALFAAGALDFESALKLVKKRAELMAALKGGGMAAVMSLQEQEVQDILQHNGLGELTIANYNSQNQVVLSGSEQALDKAKGIFEAHKATFLRIQVSGAFHSPYMDRAKPLFNAVLKDTKFNSPRLPVVANVTGRPHKLEQLVDVMTAQLSSPVRWLSSMRYLLDQGYENFTEMAPGNVLTNLVKQIQAS